MLDYKNIEPFVPEEQGRTEWEGEQKKVDDIVDKSFAILDFQVFRSSFGDGKNYVSIQAIDDKNQKFWFNTGSNVVLKQLEEVGKENLPKKFKYIKPKDKRYHSLTQPDM